jgi:hypothetical protein
LWWDARSLRGAGEWILVTHRVHCMVVAFIANPSRRLGERVIARRAGVGVVW